VEVWTSRTEGDSLPVTEDIGGVTVRRFVFALPRADARSLLRLPVAGVSTMRELLSAVRQFVPDVLHVQCFSGNGAYATGLSYLTGIPLVVTLQGETVMDDHDIYDHSATLRAALRLGLRRAKAVTGCSSFVLEDARHRFGLDPEKATVIFNGVDVDEGSATPVQLPFDRYVLGLGRVVHKKGFDLLLEAFSRLAALHPNVGLVIAGDGAERGPLDERAIALGLRDRVVFPGTLTRGEVGAMMRSAEVFVMPSRVEPFGMVALEAWRAGVPVVATSRGGAPEFVRDGASGLIVDPFEIPRLASALGSLLGSSNLRARLVLEGRSQLAKFSWENLVAQYEVAYRTALTAGRGRRV
jgi:glycogen(starch) synthase